MFKIFGEHDARTLAQMERCRSIGSAVGGALCADGHLGYAHPIGGVVAYEDHVSISGVGFDIACGNLAARLDVRYADLAPHAERIMADIARTISFGMGRKNAERVDHRLPDVLAHHAGTVEIEHRLRPFGVVMAGAGEVDPYKD